MEKYTKIKDNLKKHGFDVSCFQTKEDATTYLTNAIKGHTIGFGGSKTLEAMGLYEKLSIENTVFWHWKTDDWMYAFNNAARAEIYMCSANAISETGEIVNIDGNGNRLSNLSGLKEKVFIIVGNNKIVPTLDDAIWRARNIASPLNAMRYQANTPCVKSSETKCYDCCCEERLCKGMLVLFQKLDLVKSLEVIIIDENLGF